MLNPRDGKVRGNHQAVVLLGQLVDLLELLLGGTIILPARGNREGLPREWHESDSGFEDRQPLPVVGELGSFSEAGLLGNINDLQELSSWETFIQGQKLGDGVVWVLHDSGEFDMKVGREPVGRLEIVQQLNGHGIAEATVLNLTPQEGLRPEQFPLITMMGDPLRPVVRQKDVNCARELCGSNNKLF